MILLSNWHGSEVAASQEKREKSAQQHFLVHMDEEAKSRLIASARSIARGSSVDDVKKSLGPPYKDDELLGKRHDFRARVLTYYLRKKDSGANEKLDRYIIVYFDQQQRMTNIVFKLDESPPEFEWPLPSEGP